MKYNYSRFNFVAGPLSNLAVQQGSWTGVHKVDIVMAAGLVLHVVIVIHLVVEEQFSY